MGFPNVSAGGASGGPVAAPAQAEVWGYVDATGVAHFAARKLDGSTH